MTGDNTEVDMVVAVIFSNEFDSKFLGLLRVVTIGVSEDAVLDPQDRRGCKRSRGTSQEYSGLVRCWVIESFCNMA
jgi:hypothetical protein